MKNHRQKKQPMQVMVALWGMSALVPLIVLALLWDKVADPVAFLGMVLCLIPIAFAVFLIRKLVASAEILQAENTSLYEQLEQTKDRRWEEVASETDLEESRLARQKAEAQNQAKSRFLATVSHEIRTPLNGILGMNHLLQETDLSKEQKTYADAVGQSGEILLHLINDVLDYSKIEAGKLEITPVEIEIRPLIEGTVELLAPRAYEKNIEIAALVDREIPERFMIDGQRLRQVLLNLIGNAIKFTETGGVTLVVECVGGEIRFLVEDTGIGIAPEAQQRIFEEFGQADEGVGRHFGGTGLGLTISSRIVAGMGSLLRVESEVGKGSRFWFDCKIQNHSLDASGDLLQLKDNLKILAVMPDGPERAALLKMFSDMRVHAIVSDTLREAQAKLAASSAAYETFDLIIFDHRLNPALAQTKAALKEALSDLPPVLVLIAPTERSQITEIRQGGFEAYLVRPIRAKSLHKLVHELTGMPFGRDDVDRFLHDPVAAEADRKKKQLKARSVTSVLLVEDNPINALLSRALLEKENCQVITVEDGKAAVDAVRQTCDFDLVLMDLHMPGMDGIEAAKRIRQFEEEVAQPPMRIVALTADATDEARQQALDVGMDEVITKPIDQAELLVTLQKIDEKQSQNMQFG